MKEILDLNKINTIYLRNSQYIYIFWGKYFKLHLSLKININQRIWPGIFFNYQENESFVYILPWYSSEPFEGL